MVLDPRILVVDDDPEIRELLQEYLSHAGFLVDTVADGSALNRYLELSGYPDLILLDVMLPDDNGFSICKIVREQSLVPIIMLTAVSDDADQIEGLEIGADDYIAKPFNPRQLVARMNAILRRVDLMSGQKDKPLPKKIRFGDWILDTISQRIVNLLTEDEHVLSGADFSLLSLLVTHPNEAVDKDTISFMTRGREALPNERGIDVQISRLRHRLGHSEQYPTYIKTIRGSGYTLVVPVSYEKD